MSTTTGVATTHAIERHLALKNGRNEQTLTGELTLTTAYGNVQRIDPGGATRVVTLPAEAGANGMFFVIENTADAEEDLTVKDDGGSTIGTVSRGEVSMYACNGTAWTESKIYNRSQPTNQLVGARTVAGTTAVAITSATALTEDDSGGIWSVSQAAAYDIDLPSPTTGPGLRYLFYLTAPAANNVTLTVLGGAATFVGTVVLDASVIPATGSTLTFATGASALGDYIEVTSISTGLYHVRAVSSDAAGITVA